jgi:carbamate kinase
MSRKLVLFALGGNEISPIDLVDEVTGEKIDADIAAQWSRTAQTCELIAKIIKRYPNDYYIVSHGNGPQVGNILRRAELAGDELFTLPLDVCVADTQGAMGYMLAQLNNFFRVQGVKRLATTVVNQIIVDPNDIAFENPTKFIGSGMSKQEAESKRVAEGWNVKMYKVDSDGEEIWRRVVPSPLPQDVVELEALKVLLENNIVPIAGGGGGIPVATMTNGVTKGNYNIDYRGESQTSEPLTYGVEAVIDKDLSTSLIGTKLLSQMNESLSGELFIFTNVDGAKLNFGTEQQEDLRILKVSEAEKLMAEGAFPGGSMGPKIQAGINFVKNGGEKAFITRVDLYEETLAGTKGTTIVAD